MSSNLPLARFVAVLAVALASPRVVHAAGPCDDPELLRWQIAVSPKGKKPIAVAAFAAGRTEPIEQPIYGAFAFVDLDGDRHRDVVFTSGCIRSASDSVRLHRVYAACGPNAQLDDELVLVFEQEELCDRPVTIRPVPRKKLLGRGLRDLSMVRTSNEDTCVATTTTPLVFEGRRYEAGTPKLTTRCRGAR